MPTRPLSARRAKYSNPISVVQVSQHCLRRFRAAKALKVWWIKLSRVSEGSMFWHTRSADLPVVIRSRTPTMKFVSRPGQTGQEDKHSGYLLVAPGKHGADYLVASFDGKQVRLQGQLIYRGGGTMVEITPGSIAVTDTAPTVQETTRDLGTVTFTGEIVDSKCYLGVMNPGQGKVHRDCAARCLSGGIPPIFVTTDPVTTDGREQFLLVGLDGRTLGRDTLREFIAEPITIRGDLLQLGDSRLLRIDPRTLHHSPDGIEAALASETPKHRR